jgi:hypothetical protein
MSSFCRTVSFKLFIHTFIHHCSHCYCTHFNAAGLFFKI